MLGILETEIIRYDADIVGGLGKPFSGFLRHAQGYEFLSRLSRLFLDQIAEIAGGEIDDIGEISYGRDSVYGLSG